MRSASNFRAKQSILLGVPELEDGEVTYLRYLLASRQGAILQKTCIFINMTVRSQIIALYIFNGKPKSQWPRGLRRRSLAARLLRLWVRIPLGAWIFVCCECCVLSGRGLCNGLIIRSEESYPLWRVVVCDQETS